MSELNKKTLNPSEEKGSIKFTEEEIQALRLCYANSNIRKHHELIESTLEKLQANGESPEVDNPVTQTQLEKEVTDYLTNNNIHYKIIHNTIDIIKGNLNRIQMSKVVETTKEQPNLCECCGRKPIETAKGMCKQCSEYW